MQRTHANLDYQTKVAPASCRQSREAGETRALDSRRDDGATQDFSIRMNSPLVAFTAIFSL